MTYRYIHYPLNLANQWRRDFNGAFAANHGNGRTSYATSSLWSPAVDIQETDDAYVLRADLPGVDPKDIEVNMEKGVLTIKGERSTEAAQERHTYTRRERVGRSFYRRFSLPDTADRDRITAKSNNGVLEVLIPKQELVKPRRVTVQ